jgi:hypothetical protein
MSLIAAVTIVAIVWDIIVAIEPTPGDTISKVVLDMFSKHPSAAFVAGGLLGHFSSPLLNHLPVWWLSMSIPVLAVISVLVITVDVVGWMPEGLMIPVWSVLVGMLFAFFLWPQRVM